MHLEFIEEPASFLDAAGGLLAADPVLTTVLTTVTARLAAADEAGTPRPDHPRWWAIARENAGGRVLGVAMRTAPFRPHPLYVLRMPDAAATALARLLHERGEDVPQVNGVLEPARVIAAEIVRLTGGQIEVVEHQRLFEVTELVDPPLPPGRLRPANSEDAELVTAWFRAFHADADEQAGREPDPSSEQHFGREDVADRVTGGRVWLWEEPAGKVVHLTGHTAPAYGVVRVGPVYTPRRHRGRGYASAAVAEVSRRLLDVGHRVCLFTDQANPTSNRIYQRLGYRPVADMGSVVVDGGVTRPAPA